MQCVYAQALMKILSALPSYKTLAKPMLSWSLLPSLCWHTAAYLGTLMQPVNQRTSMMSLVGLCIASLCLCR